MRNPILEQLNQSAPQRTQNTNLNNQPGNILEQFQKFRNEIGGRNPQQIVEGLLQSGKMSQSQFEQLKQQASMIKSMLGR